MSSNLNQIDYLEIACSLSSLSDNFKQTIKNTFDPLMLVDFSRFREGVKKEMNDIVCTPTEDPSIDELRNFFDEDLPIQLQRANRKSLQKELQRMNSTIMINKKDSSATIISKLSSTVLGNPSASVNSISNISTTKLSRNDEQRTPIEIYKDYKNIITTLDELLEKKLNNLNVTDNNIALQKTKKIIEDLEKLGNLLKEEDTREAFTLKQEEDIKKIGNIISQYVFILQHKDLFTNDIQNYESSDILITAVNDLLNEITLIS